MEEVCFAVLSSAGAQLKVRNDITYNTNGTENLLIGKDISSW